MTHGSSCDMEIWRPSVEHVTLGLRPRVTSSCDMFNLGSSYFHVTLTTVRHLLTVISAFQMYVLHFGHFFENRKNSGLTPGQNDDPVTRTWKMTQMTHWPGDPMTQFHVCIELEVAGKPVGQQWLHPGAHLYVRTQNTMPSTPTLNSTRIIRTSLLWQGRWR